LRSIPFISVEAVTGTLSILCGISRLRTCPVMR
jgi:hypothetical protein